MDAKALAVLREHVRFPDRHPHFLYFPKSGKNAWALTFYKTASARDAELRRLRTTRTGVPAVGVLEQHGEEPIVFRTVAKPPTSLATELKKVVTTVPELRGARIGQLGKVESTDIGVKGTLGHKISKAFSRLGGGAAPQEEVAVGEDPRPAHADERRRLEREWVAFDGVAAEELERQARLREHVRARATLAASDDHGLAQDDLAALRTTLKQVDRDWGVLTAQQADMANALLAARIDLDELATAWERATGQQRRADLEARLQEARDTLAAAEPMVARFVETMNRMDVLVHSLGGREDAPSTTPAALRGVRHAPDEDDPSTLQQRATARLEAVERELTRLSGDETFALLAGRAPLLAEVSAATPPGLEGEELAAWRTVVGRAALLTRQPDQRIRAQLQQPDAGRAVAALSRGGLLSTAEATDHVRRAHQVMNDLDRFAPEGRVTWQTAHPEHAAVLAHVHALSALDLSLATSGVARLAGEGESLVPKSAGTRVAVAGGGPVGLLAAIEAAMRGATVTVYEARRAAYSRSNVLTLDPDTLQRLRRAGIADAIPGVVENGAAPVKSIEEAAMARALALGVTYAGGQAVKGVKRDERTGEVVLTLAGAKAEPRVDLLIVAVGSGIKDANKHADNVVMAKELGVKIQTIGQPDYAVAAVFERTGQDEVGAAPRPRLDRVEKAQAWGEWSVLLKGGDTDYRLGGLSQEQFEQFQQDPQALRRYVLGTVKDANRFQGLELTNVGTFKIVLQRAERVTVPEKGAVLIGDAAATPHPQKGSGANTGISEVSVAGDLVEELIQSVRAGRITRSQGMGAYEEEVGAKAKSATKKGLDALTGTVRDRIGRIADVVRRMVEELAPDAPGFPHGAAITAEARALHEHAKAEADIGRDDPQVPEQARVDAHERLVTLHQAMQAALRTATEKAGAEAQLQSLYTELRELRGALGLSKP